MVDPEHGFGYQKKMPCFESALPFPRVTHFGTLQLLVFGGCNIDHLRSPCRHEAFPVKTNTLLQKM